MIIARQLSAVIHERKQTYPVISVTGPRQSGKTTLVRSLFPEMPYVSLERPDVREQAVEDPHRFLRSFENGVILDEVQRVPELFSYIQVIVDETKNPGSFILTGSQNFLLLEKITQSLAGRVAVLKLLPFSIMEVQDSPYAHDDLDAYLFKGAYPPVYDRGYEPHAWYMDYLQTYIERDVRLIRSITDLSLFQKFIKLCAGRVGQLLNFNSLATECGISHNTASDWMSILEASYLVFKLPPYFENFNKRVVKQPKLYFYDTGLLCALLGVTNSAQLSQHYLRGNIFESFVVSEFVKSSWSIGQPGFNYFWRDNHGHEIDYLWQYGDAVTPVEIKSGETVHSSMFNGLKYWAGLTNMNTHEGCLIYGGKEMQERKYGKVVGWTHLPELLYSGA